MHKHKWYFYQLRFALYIEMSTGGIINELQINKPRLNFRALQKQIIV